VPKWPKAFTANKLVDQKLPICYNSIYNTKTELKMSAETQKQYAILLIKAEAARAVSDFEDYFAYKAIAERLTNNS
jgi:hypothetical protein